MLSLKPATLNSLKTIKRSIMDREDNKTYAEKLENDQKILRIAMINAYRLITNKITYEDLINRDDQGMWLPDGFRDGESIPHLIEYFIETEEYEKCQELLDKQKELEKTNQANELTKIFNNTKWIPPKKEE